MKTYLTGLSILVGAIILNIISSQLGLFSWYDVLSSPYYFDQLWTNNLLIFNPIGLVDLTNFLMASPTPNLFNWIYLFILYPLGLGFAAKVGQKIFHDIKN